jgi:hypothetical protein
MGESIDVFFAHLDQFVIGSAVATFVVHYAISAWKGSPDALNSAFLKCFSGASIPNGLAFLVCAFLPEYIPKIQGATLAFALAGLALIAASAKDILKVAPAKA